MGVVLFRCPRTGLKVQGFVADVLVADDPCDVPGDAFVQVPFVQVQCQACGRTHFVDPETDSTQAEQTDALQ